MQESALIEAVEPPRAGLGKRDSDDQMNQMYFVAAYLSVVLGFLLLETVFTL